MRHIHRLLQQCLDQAVRDGLMTENPVRAFHYSKPKKIKANVLTPLEMEDYLDAAERLGYLPMFLLALTAGLRQGELIALKWSDLNVKERTLTISEQRSVERRELVQYGTETRTITLTSEVVDLLVEEHAKHPTSPLMFMHPATLKPFSPQMVRRMHNEIIKEAGLEHIRFTDLRHSLVCMPYRLEYSIKDDKFRLQSLSKRDIHIINLACVRSCELLEEYESSDMHLPAEHLCELTLLLHDERNALERVLLHFSHFEKETIRLDDRLYQIRLQYDQTDETELLIRVLSFGPVLEVKAPSAFIDLVKERLVKQKRLKENAIIEKI